MEQSVVNGISVEELNDAMSVVKDNAEAAQFTFKAKNRWAGGAAAFTTIQDFTIANQENRSRPAPFILEGGEPDVLLGIDNAPNATEAVLHALACCLNASLIYHAAARGITIQELELDMEGDIDIRGFLGVDDKVRNGYQQIRVTFKVAADASAEQINELTKLAQERSPVFDIVTHGVPVNASVEILGTSTEKPIQASM